MGAQVRVLTLNAERELWRELGTDRYYVRERTEDAMPSTSVRDLRARRYVGRFETPHVAAMHAMAIR